VLILEEAKVAAISGLPFEISHWFGKKLINHSRATFNNL